ncbi:MAG: HTH domain-containing protein, partial [Prevotella sp.]
ENIGSGFPLILSAWNEKHWLKPELIEQPELMQVKLILHIEDKVQKPLVSKDGTKDETKELSGRQSLLLSILKEDDTLTIPQMTLKTNVSRSTILRELVALKKRGILSRKGGRKKGKWIIKAKD